MMKEKYISEAALKDEPKKKLSLKIKEGSITPEHFNKKEVDAYLLDVVGAIEETGMLPEDKAKLDALPTAEELDEKFAGIQKTLTFDNAPVSGSSNPVTSDGVYQAIQNLMGEYYAE